MIQKILTSKKMRKASTLSAFLVSAAVAGNPWNASL